MYIKYTLCIIYALNIIIIFYIKMYIIRKSIVPNLNEVKLRGYVSYVDTSRLFKLVYCLSKITCIQYSKKLYYMY